MLPFQDAAPTPAGDWRHIVRFGRNVASYKFALGQALLDLAARQLLRYVDLVVLDLSGFTTRNLGTGYELQRVIDLFPGRARRLSR